MCRFLIVACLFTFNSKGENSGRVEIQIVFKAIRWVFCDKIMMLFYPQLSAEADHGVQNAICQVLIDFLLEILIFNEGP